MPAVLGALVLLALVLGVALLRVRNRTERELQTAHAEAAALRAQMEEIERRLAVPAHRTGGRDADQPDFVITHLGDVPRLPRHSAAAAVDDDGHGRVEPTLFADLVLRETVVKAASLAHGLRIALAPESRNRIRFEVRREVRRARKQRRSELKEARRDWEARQRARLADDGDAA